MSYYSYNLQSHIDLIALLIAYFFEIERTNFNYNEKSEEFEDTTGIIRQHIGQRYHRGNQTTHWPKIPQG